MSEEEKNVLVQKIIQLEVENKRLRKKRRKAREEAEKALRRAEYAEKRPAIANAEARGEVTQQMALANDLVEMARKNGNVGVLRQDIETIAAQRDDLAARFNAAEQKTERLIAELRDLWPAEWVDKFLDEAFGPGKAIK